MFFNLFFIFILLNYFSKFWDFYENDLYKNTIIVGLSITVCYLFINNRIKDVEIKKLETINNKFKLEYTDTWSNNNNNAENWNFLFNNYMYDLYNNSDIFNPFMNFDTTLYSIFHAANVINLDKIENLTRINVINTIYNKPKGFWIYCYNYHQINFEIYNCFRKINVLMDDFLIYSFLEKKHGLNLPQYNENYTGLSRILRNENKMPLSYSHTYIKKYTFESIYKNPFNYNGEIDEF